jgi:HAD superfamily hydrolase (TIGR01509 family)
MPPSTTPEPTAPRVPENTTRALLIDFGGTLFVGLDGKRWLAAAARKASVELTGGQHATLAALLDSRLPFIRLPGSDLSAAAHRESLVPVLESLVEDAALAAALYDLQLADDFWQLRGGARELLRGAVQRGMRVIVVSNIPWDLRPLFAAAGVHDLIHGFTLSCEVGAEKPDKLIFEHALGIAGCPPSQAVFVGDDPVNDAGALGVGIPVILVPAAQGGDDRVLYEVADWLNGPAGDYGQDGPGRENGIATAQNRLLR